MKALFETCKTSYNLPFLVSGLGRKGVDGSNVIPA
jgi:hypothetical protein